MEIDQEDIGTRRLLVKASQRYPLAVSQGILHRVREGSILPFRAENILMDRSFAYEDDELLEIAMSTETEEFRARCAAATLGPEGAGQLLDKHFELSVLVGTTGSEKSSAAVKQNHTFRERVHCIPITVLLEATSARSEHADSVKLKFLADQISGRLDGGYGLSPPLDADAQATIAKFVQDWGERLLKSSESTREQLASIARLACQAPCKSLLPVLRRLLDEELGRWKMLLDEVSTGSKRQA